VDMKAIFIALMTRLSSYLADSGNVIENIENGFSVYELFSVNIKELVRKSEANELKNTLNLYAAFLQFTLKCYPSKHEFVNEILGDASAYCASHETAIDDDCQLYISKFLTHPLETMANIILTMNEYPNLIKYLRFKRKRDVAKQITKAIVRGGIDLNNENMVTQVLTFIEPLLVRLPDYEAVSDLLFKEEQIQVSKIVFFINSEDPAQNWAILKKLIDRFVAGGDERMRYTIPSTLFRLYQLCMQVYNGRDESTEPKVYKRFFDTSRALLGKLTTFPHLSIKLYLELLMLINLIDSETKFYDEYTYVNIALFRKLLLSA
jgi:vacuolar protein sorting-associated protein 35